MEIQNTIRISDASLATFPSCVIRMLSKTGQFAGLYWRRTLKTYKGVTDTVTKEVRCTTRIGIEHDKREVVKEARANGDAPAENAGLNGKQWAIYPHILQSIKDPSKFYLRVYPVHGRKPRTIYRLNGVAVEWSAVAHLVTAQDHPKQSEPHDCFDITVTSVLRAK